MSNDDIDKMKTIFDDSVLSTDDELVDQIDLNPKYYLHFAILKLQNCYLATELKDGLMRFVLMTTHIESLAYAAGMIDQAEYDEIIIEANDKNKEEKDDLVKRHNVANAKLIYILRNMFLGREYTSPMKFKSKNTKG